MSLENIKPGDVLCCRSRSSRIGIDDIAPLTLSMHTVERLTNKQAVLKNGTRVWLKDGTVVSDAFTRLRIATLEEIKTYKDQVEYRNRYRSALLWFDTITNKRRKLTVDQLEAMKSAYELVPINDDETETT